MIRDFNPLKPLRFWCQKVLPLVYDDSLSYYEVLCKVVDYINKFGDDLRALTTQYVELFNRLGEVAKPIINEWLDNHPEATTTVEDGSITVEKFHPSVVDKTLTESGHPADALITGNAIRNPTDINIDSTAVDNTFTVATYNVLGTNYWRYPTHTPCLTDRALVAISRVIQKANPDIVSLNEVSKIFKYNSLSKLKSIGYPNSHYNGNRVVGYQNSQLGDAIMTREEYELTNIVDTSWIDQADEERHLIKATIKINNKNVSVYTTHLSLVTDNRREELSDIIMQMLADNNPYKILMGDMNFSYGSEEYEIVVNSGLVSVNNDTPTYIGSNDIIDYIFVTNNITVNEYGVVSNTDASDHALLWANITLE